MPKQVKIPRAFAQGTHVSVDKSHFEINTRLREMGADQFLFAESDKGAVIGFRLKGRMYKVEITFPPTKKFGATPTGRERKSAEAAKLQDKEVQRRWRALLLYIKATLEAINSGIVSEDNAFMSYVLIEDGLTLGEWAKPRLDEVYTSGKALPKLG